MCVTFVTQLSFTDPVDKVGPRIEYCKGALFADKELSAFLPFLALPDGAHLVSNFVIFINAGCVTTCRARRIIRIFILLLAGRIQRLFSVYRQWTSLFSTSINAFSSPSSHMCKYLLNFFAWQLLPLHLLRCNMQIPTQELRVKDTDVTRSTVQKAVVVLAAKPIFGPIK